MRVNFRKINEALDNIENYKSYYIGDTLCIDFDYHPAVALNRNGRGFSFMAGTQFDDGRRTDSQKFIVTREIQDKINKIYNKHKGGGK